MKMIIKFFQIIYSVYAMVLFIVIMFLVVPVAFLTGAFGVTRGGNMVYTLSRIWSDIWLFAIGIRHSRVIEQGYDASVQYIYVANHCSYMDVPMIMKAVRTPLRILGKVEMGRIPVFGYLYRSAVVMVDRSDADKRARSVMRLKAVLRSGISIFIFPEGTFNMNDDEPLKSFYDGAFRIAVETGTPILPLIFLDSRERMHPGGIFTITPGRSRTLYLPPVSTEGLSSKDVQALKDKVYRQMEAALRAKKSYPASSVGTR